MVSTQEAGQRTWAHLIVERFGPFAFGLALVARDNRLYFIPRRWVFFGIPLPKSWMPKGDTYEKGLTGKFHFHVEINLPLIWRVICYDCALERV